MEKKVKLGKVTVTTDGSGIWKMPPGIPVDLELYADIVKEDGMLYGSLSGKHIAIDGAFLYTDKAVEKQINEHLETLGYNTKVDSVEWSEQGRQEYDLLDMDIGEGIAKQMLEMGNK